ncbi:MAG TPA: biotin--[acetyl-CoA-carboxylase] ligase [Spirochaetota bacterium]|nr:biotin--[acetyl-CoA-carboxylase] ligase [Spirochaetota bacterium]HOK93524.1 biotin--[acetyl-CoA-carboxylase] ligase [Spirochaetota bacterium]HPD79074.1 biotin--[acetyl-CoA-carboxylase] ligase [Spirochaetota bacterium]HPP94400.1 biotin--[acetyl-CoA-carboxylase] ligase [Spirochaetota bacterium]HRS64193.1 biotin--[acetyl-CoA-carboxylase] ligase [Spirochaetota bacterium]
MENSRSKILKILYNTPEQWISGEEISHSLSITRSAVWKNINLLREMGYSIDSCTKRGHKLTIDNDILDEFNIKHGLRSEIFGQREILVFDTIDSTNIKAFQLATEGYPEGTIILAQQQTSGKGRLGRRWSSPYGKNIYISIISRPFISPMDAPKLTLTSAIAVFHTIEKFNISNVEIKWPNDILVNGKKICGILNEMKGDSDSVDFIITGIGININQKLNEFPEELQNTATSFEIIKNQTTGRVEVIKALLENFEKYYKMLTSGNFEDILAQWSAKAQIVGKKIKVQQLKESFVGTVKAITVDGNLLLDTEAGIKEISSGDINYI